MLCLDCSSKTMSSRLRSRTQSSQGWEEEAAAAAANTIDGCIAKDYQAIESVLCYYENRIPLFKVSSGIGPLGLWNKRRTSSKWAGDILRWCSIWRHIRIHLWVANKNDKLRAELYGEETEMEAECWSEESGNICEWTEREVVRVRGVPRPPWIWRRYWRGMQI